MGKSDTNGYGNDKPAKGFNSRFVQARNEPNPVDDLALCAPGEPVMPLGGLVETQATEARRWYGPTESEYIIFEENQIALKYLIRFS